MRAAWMLLGLGLGLGLGAGVAAAQPSAEIAALEQVWTRPMLAAPLLSPEFAAAVPIARLSAIMADIQARCGGEAAFRSAHAPGAFVIATAQCEIPTVLRLDAQGRISTLFFRAPIRLDADVQELLDQAQALAPSFAAALHGVDVPGRDADVRLPVGSAFKLIVLAELRRKIRAGEADWADVMTLEDRHRSHPTGRLHLFETGAPFTLHTLAAAMISESDNTATDMLIDFLGADRLEAASGLAPFLTTRAFFQLKLDPALAAAYRAADIDGRRAILERLRDAALPPISGPLPPADAEIEWRLSAAALCKWMEAVSGLALTGLNPGVVDPAQWRRVAFKGGSEPGVFNLTTGVEAEGGGAYCLSTTWNGLADADQAQAGALHRSLLHAMARR